MEGDFRKQVSKTLTREVSERRARRRGCRNGFQKDQFRGGG